MYPVLRRFQLLFVGSLLFTGLVTLFPYVANGQVSCQQAEVTLKTAFMRHAQGTTLPMEKVQTAYASCLSPTAPMELVYYYFKSLEAYESTTEEDLTRYYDAAHFYEQANTQFTYLIAPPKSDAKFAARYIARAQKLEVQLDRLAQSLGIQPVTYQREDQTAGNWQKDVRKSDFSPQTQSTRGVSRSDSTGFDKRYLYVNESQEPAWRKQQGQDVEWRGEDLYSIQNGRREPQGRVGNLNELNLYNYLRFKRNNRSTPTLADNPFPGGMSRGISERTDPAVNVSDPILPTVHTQMLMTEAVTPAMQPLGNSTQSSSSALPSAGVSRGLTRGLSVAGDARTNPLMGNDPQAQVMTNIFHPLAIRKEAGGREATIDIIAFGDQVVMNRSVPIKEAQGNDYVSVQTRHGVTGWAELAALVPDARMAATISGLSVYSRPNSGTPSGTVDAGNLLVLSDQQGDWIKAHTYNGADAVWIKGIGSLSIEPVDVAIAHAFQEATMLADPHKRRTQLVKIRQLPGYSTSPLAAGIEQVIRSAK